MGVVDNLQKYLRRFKLYRYLGAQSNYFRRKWRHVEPFNVTRDDFAEQPTEIDVSLSAICNAHCRFCYPNRGKEIDPKLMPRERAQKIFRDLADWNYQGAIYFGGMGEFTLHPEVREILADFREILPDVYLGIYTNMSSMDAEMTEVVLNARPHSVTFNIDGACARTYNAMKPGLDFEVVMANVKNFLRRRDEREMNTSISVMIANYRRYARDVEGKKADIPNDTAEVIRMLKPMLRDTDGFNAAEHGFGRWAVQEAEGVAKSDYCEMWFDRRNYFGIASDGRLYLCCIDHNARVNFGNADDAPLRELWRNDEHIRLWSLITEQRFAEVGLPCATCNRLNSRPSW